MDDSRALARRATLLVALLEATAEAHEPGASRYDYERHVRPLFERHCTACHHPSGAAPMSLLTYEEAIPWARAIKLRVLEGQMPPWLPAEGVGSWRGARGLSAPEVDQLVEWASGGTPRGAEQGVAVTVAPSAAPAAASSEPRTRAPDLVLEASRETVLAPEESERTECEPLAPGLDAETRVVGISFLPSNPRAARLASLHKGDACAPAERPLAVWQPGDDSFDLPEGAAVVLGRGTRLSVRVLYRKPWALAGQALRGRSRVALRFARERTTALAHLDVEEGGGATLKRAVRLVSVFPRGSRGAPLHLALRGAGTEAGRRVFAVDRFDPEWRAQYLFATPLALAAGTRLEAVGGGFWIAYLPDEDATSGATRRGAR